MTKKVKSNGGESYESWGVQMFVLPCERGDRVSGGR